MEKQSDTDKAAEGKDTTIPDPDKEILDRRRERRESRKEKRREETLKKKVEAIRNPASDKLTVISQRTFNKLSVQDVDPEKKTVIRNKQLKASQSQFALTDFLVKKEKPPKAKGRVNIPGTTVPLLKKGKVREIPKKKALSRLKRAIVNIRNKRKQIQEPDPSTEPKLIDPVIPDLEPLQEPQPPITFSRKFRAYCDHHNDPGIRESAEKILSDLFRFQDRAYEKNQIKAQAHRRYVVGFKEVQRSLEVNKVKLLFIAPDLEPNPGPGGIDETVEDLKALCKEKAVPYCFPLQRRKIGYLLFKKAPISCVGIMDFSGSEEHVQNLLKLVNKSRALLHKEMEKLEIK